MLRKSVYPKIESTLTQAAKYLHQQGITPNQLTLGGLALNFFSGCIYASGHFFWGGIMMGVAALGDLLDGPLARSTGKVTKFGAFLDSSVDRYSDFFIFGGAAVFYAQQLEIGMLLLCLGTIMGAYVTSYTKARAENFIENCSTGIFERSERLIALGIGSIFTGLLPLVFWVLFIGTNATALQRILFTQKALSSSEPPASH